MASRVDFSVSCNPIYTHAAGEGTEVDTLASDVGKSLGGSGSIVATWGTTVGYAGGSPSLATAHDNYAVGQTALTLGTFTAHRFVFIKHSGFLADGTNVSDVDVKIVNGSSNIADVTTVAVLGPGEAIVLPFKSDDATPSFWAAVNGEAVGVEVMVTP